MFINSSNYFYFFHFPQRRLLIHVDIGILNNWITIRCRFRSRSSLARFRSIEEAHCARHEHDFASVDPFERRASPFSSPTGRQAGSLGRQVKLKTFTPALPPHLPLEPGASSYYACNRLYNCLDHGAVPQPVEIRIKFVYSNFEFKFCMIKILRNFNWFQLWENYYKHFD